MDNAKVIIEEVFGMIKYAVEQILYIVKMIQDAMPAEGDGVEKAE